jgi:hypothetical protein
MRTALCEICLFNDNLMIMHDRVFISKQNMRGSREQDSGVTERERESVRDRALLDMRDSIGNKIDRWRKIFMSYVGD